VACQSAIVAFQLKSGGIVAIASYTYIDIPIYTIFHLSTAQITVTKVDSWVYADEPGEWIMAGALDESSHFKSDSFASWFHRGKSGSFLFIQQAIATQHPKITTQ